MTKKQSTKRIRLFVVIAVVALTLMFLGYKSLDPANDLLVDPDNKANLKGQDDIDWKEKFNQGKAKGKDKGKTDSSSKGDKKVSNEEEFDDVDFMDEEEFEKEIKKVPSKPKNVKIGSKEKANAPKPEQNKAEPKKAGSKDSGSKESTGKDKDKTDKPNSKQQTSSKSNGKEASSNKSGPEPKNPPVKTNPNPPKVIPNGIPKPINPEEEDDPNNPNGFLGGIEEMSPEEMEANGSIYVEQGDEEEFKKAQDNKIGEIDHEDSFGHNPKNTQGYGRLGVPRPDKFGKSLPKTVTMPEIPFPSVIEQFGKIDIEPLNFRIYSHNVKNGGHDILVPGEETWNDRYRKITNSIKFNSLSNTIVTLQEVYKFQMLNIMDDLNRFSDPNDPEWSYYGQGRIDGDEIGEFVPILYKNSEWELVFNDTIWLNDKNERMSLEGWDAKYLRILSYVTLRHRQTGNYINVFNTHLDHIGELSRIGSAELIVKKMEAINKWPSFLCGDLNNEPKGETYQVLTNDLVDTAKHSTPFNRFGHVQSTVTGFEGEVLGRGGQNIDYIFAPKYTKKITSRISCSNVDSESNDPSDKLLLRLDAFGLLHSKYNGVYMSDHRPLVADFYLAGKC